MKLINMKGYAINAGLATILLSFCGGEAGAVPTLYPTQVTKLMSIQNSTNSNLISDDVDLNRIYVMPPNTATGTVKGLHTLTTNLGFCSEMKIIQGYSSSLTDRISQLTDEEVESRTELKKYEEALTKARTAAADFATARGLESLVDLDQNIAAVDERLSALYLSIDACKANCEAAMSEARELAKEKIKLVKNRRELAKQKAADAREYERHKQKVEAAQANYNDVAERYKKIVDRVTSVQAQLLSLYSRFGQMEGARAAFDYASSWDENVMALKNANPEMSFEKINTANAKVYASALNLPNIPADRAILAFEVPGAPGQGHVSLTSFPTSLNANVVLSLVGACPLAYPEMFPNAVGANADSMKYGMTITYEYPSSFKLKVAAKYNMYKMYEKIQTSGSRGGFFSSRSWSRTEEKNFFKDSFRVEWDIQDPSNTVSNEEREEIEATLRREVMTRLATLALPSVPDRQGVVAAVKPGPHGAVVMADSLVKACPGNVYCIAGAIALNVLDSIFGSSKTTASYLHIQDIEVEEVWSKDMVTLKPWITVYNP